MRTILFIVLLAVDCASSAQCSDVQFDEDGFLIVDGSPRLLLGIYDLPKDSRGYEDALLRQLAANGFDFKRGAADKETLDTLHSYGLKGWIRLHSLRLPKGDAEAKGRLAATVNEFKDHPALIAWEGPDEALWRHYLRHHEWFNDQQPAELSRLIDEQERDGGPNVERLRSMLDSAGNYMQRSAWPEAEAVYARMWSELGAENPHPDLTMTAAAEGVPALAKEYARGWALVRQLDPAHPRWVNHAPCNSTADRALFAEGATCVGCDIYPAPNYSGVRGADFVSTLEPTAVGVCVDLMQQSAPGKPTWMLLQGFGWHDQSPNKKEPNDPIRGRRPNLQETRFMAYDALLHGADALLFWGLRYIEKDSQLWKDVMRTGRELRALEPAIVAPESTAKPVVVPQTNWTTFDGGDPKIMVRQVGEEWVIIAVNEWRNGVAFDIQNLPQSLNGRTLYRLYTDEVHKVTDGAFHDSILGHDVHVYATSRTFESSH